MKLLLLIVILILIGCSSISKVSSTDSNPSIYQKFKYAPHILDSGATLGLVAIDPSYIEVNPAGIPLTLFNKVALEGLAISEKESGNPKMCTALASGSRIGGWVGLGATVGGLIAGGVPGLVGGGLLAGVISYNPSVNSAVYDCYQNPNYKLDNSPYSYSGEYCVGWTEARPDNCNQVK